MTENENNNKKMKESLTQESNDNEKSEKSEEKKEEPKKIEKSEEELKLEKLKSLEKSELISQILDKDKLLSEQGQQIKEQKDWKTKFMHLQAEFENAQKRWDRSRNDLRNQAQAHVLKDFLPLYDSFTKAMESDAGIIKQFYIQFLNVFKGYKAEPMSIEKGDPFNYEFHEAITSLESENLPDNSIMDIIQNGWKIDKDILRYAKVVISKKPKPPEPEPEPELNEKAGEKIADKEQEGMENKDVIHDSSSQINKEAQQAEKKQVKE